MSGKCKKHPASDKEVQGTMTSGKARDLEQS